MPGNPDALGDHRRVVRDGFDKSQASSKAQKLRCACSTQVPLRRNLRLTSGSAEP